MSDMDADVRALIDDSDEKRQQAQLSHISRPYIPRSPSPSRSVSSRSVSIRSRSRSRSRSPQPPRRRPNNNNSKRARDNESSPPPAPLDNEDLGLGANNGSGQLKERFPGFEPDEVNVLHMRPNQDPDADCEFPRWCFMCYFSQMPHEVESNPHYDKLNSFWNDHYGKIEPCALVAQLQYIYRTELQPYLEGDYKGRPWTQRCIWAHFEFHAPTPLSFITRRLLVYNELSRVLENHGLVYRATDGSKRQAVTNACKELDLYNKVTDYTMKLLAQKSKLPTSRVL